MSTSTVDSAKPAGSVEPAKPGTALGRFIRWFFYRARGDSPFKSILVHATLIFACIIAVYPVLRVITISLRPNDTLLTTNLRIIPENATLDNYKEVLFGNPEKIANPISSYGYGTLFPLSRSHPS